MIYRKPHEKSVNKSVKKLESEQHAKKQEPKKFTAKPAPNMNKPPKIPVKASSGNGANNNKTVNQKVEQLQKMVEKIQNTKANEDLQEILLKEIKGIKSQLSQIKTQIGMKGVSNYQEQHINHEQSQQNQPDQQEQEQNIMNFKNNGSELRQLPVTNNKPATNSHNPPIESRPNIKSFASTKPKQKKVLLEIGKIQPYMKEFKLQNTQSKILQPFYYGYHKKSSKPIIVKYCDQNHNMDFVKGMYERLWKNIVKAKNICINKIYDLNEPLATYILVLEQNKCGLEGIQMNPFKISQEILKALQFMHECGYLYRNIHPSHVMLSYENNIVLLDLKKMKKFVDIKGKVIDVKGNDEDQDLDEFVANSRIKNSSQGRKDDLQCLGYLTLWMLEGKLPWNADNMIQVRSKLLLNQIFGKYPGLLKYMIQVHKLPTHQAPNYSGLLDLLQP